jgi:hypothetical protein
MSLYQGVPSTYTTLSKREKALIYDTEQMLSIRERMRNQEPIPELSGEKRAG